MSHSAKVGILSIVFFISLFFILKWLDQLKIIELFESSEGKAYYVAKFDNVTGLKNGAKVSFNGNTIGEIKRVERARGGRSLATLEIPETTILNRNADFMIMKDGLFAEAQININQKTHGIIEGNMREPGLKRIKVYLRKQMDTPELADGAPVYWEGSNDEIANVSILQNDFDSDIYLAGIDFKEDAVYNEVTDDFVFVIDYYEFDSDEVQFQDVMTAAEDESQVMPPIVVPGEDDEENGDNAPASFSIGRYRINPAMAAKEKVRITYLRVYGVVRPMPMELAQTFLKKDDSESDRSVREQYVVLGTRQESVEDVIAKAGQFITEAEANLTKLAEQVDVTMGELNTLLKDANRLFDVESTEEMLDKLFGDVEMALKNTREITEEIKGLVGEHREDIDIIIANIKSSTDKADRAMQRVEELLANGGLEENLEEIMTNLKEATTNMKTISEDVLEITHDPELKEDLKNSVAQAGQLMDDAAKTLDDVQSGLETVRNIDFGARLEATYYEEDDRYSTDFNVTFKANRDDPLSLLAGVEDISETDKFNLQVGYEPTDYVRLRAGLKRSAVGAGLDLYSRNEEVFIRGDLYEPEDIRWDMTLGVRLNKYLWIVGGVDDITETDQVNFGFEARF